MIDNIVAENEHEEKKSFLHAAALKRHPETTAFSHFHGLLLPVGDDGGLIDRYRASEYGTNFYLFLLLRSHCRFPGLVINRFSVNEHGSL